jgi:hypothetical protein
MEEVERVKAKGKGLVRSLKLKCNDVTEPSLARFPPRGGGGWGLANMRSQYAMANYA